MSTAVWEKPTLVAAFNNDRLGLCANVHELPESNDFEVSVMDAFSGDVVVSRNFSSKEMALKIVAQRIM